MDPDHPSEEGALWHPLLDQISLEPGGLLTFRSLPQVRPLNADGSLNLLGLETVRLIYFRNKMAGKNLPVGRWSDPGQDNRS